MKGAIILPSSLLIISSSFVAVIAAETIAQETPFEKVSAYSTILSLITASPSSMHPCATECAIMPSITFKSKYSCDIVNPVSCICGNGTRSVELRSSISDYCYNKCAWEMITLATAILSDYCVENKAVQTQVPITGSPTETTETTASATSTATNAPAPPTDRNGLSVSDIAGIVTAVVGVLGTIASIWIAVLSYKRDKRLGRDPWPNRTKAYIVRTLFNQLRNS
jgi:hypothetical protein